jgi:hypothetical protein
MKVWITRQQARSFGSLRYNKAKAGYKLLVTWHGEAYWLCYVIPHGFYLEAYELQAA